MKQRTARRPIRRRLRRLAAAAAVALMAAACGSDSADSDDASDTSETAAAPTTTAAPSTTTTTTTTPPPLDNPHDLIEAAFENSRGRSVRGDLTMRVGELFGVEMTFEGDGTQNFAMTSKVADDSQVQAGITYHVRYVDEQAYLKIELPAAFAAFIGEDVLDGWYLLDAESAALIGIICPSPQLSELSEEGGCLLPNDYMNQIGYIFDAEIVGTEEIDGIATTQVRYSLDYAALTAAELGIADAADADDAEADDDAAMGEGIARSFSPFVLGADNAPDTFVYDTWIDADGLTRRQVLDFGTFLDQFAESMADADAEQLEGLPDPEELADSSIVINFYDYDTPIEIEAPTEDEVLGHVGELYDAMGIDRG